VAKAAADNERERVAKWWDRLDASREIWKEQQRFWNKLENALAGEFPACIPGAKGDDMLRLGHNDQLSLNLLLRTKRIFESSAFDEFPTLRFSREPDMDEEVVVSAERLIEKIMDDGGAVYESKTAMGSSMTRGAWIVWVDVVDAQVSPSELAAARIPPEAFIEAALTGQEYELPHGADYQAIAEAANAVVNTPETALGLTPEQAEAVTQLAVLAEKAYTDSLDERHGNERRAKIKFEATPYGSWCLFDMSVTERRRMAWVARKLVMTPDEVEQDPRFKKSAKERLLEAYTENRKELDGHVPGKVAQKGTTPAVDEQDRIVIWRVEDRTNWKWHYISEIYKDGFLEADDACPYMNENGTPLFPDFFSCVVRTPLEHNKEVPSRMLGIPVLEPGWAHQVEFIKTRSAWVISCKKSGRQFVVPKGLSQAMQNLLARGGDGDVIFGDQSYDPVKDGELVKPILWGQAPVDFLLASKQVMADYANAVGINLAALTGEPVADTLGQEQIAMTGSNITSMDMVRCYESGYAELACKAFLVFKANALPNELAAYLGQKATMPRQTDAGMIPSIYDSMRAMPLDGCKLVARFASGTRAEDAVRIKQLQDFVALNNTILEPITQQPYFDPRPLVLRIAKSQDIEGLVVNPAIAMMKAAMQAAAEQGVDGDEGQEEKGGDREAPGGGRNDGRKAGGERGAPAVPGRQSRQRAPQTGSQMHGVANRAHGATA
jgi:hypothetical protein